MHTKKSLLRDLEKAGINKCGTLLVHSSMKALGEVNGGADTVLDAFIEYMKEGLLLFPTHSWSEDNLKDNIYDPLTEPSCVGLITNLFMKRKNVYRSLHPTHSVSAIGSRAKEYIQNDNDVHTPCPRHGCFGSLYDENADILFLGTSLQTNTFLHSVEEWMKVPDRINQKAKLIRIKLDDGTYKEVELFSHHSSHGDVSKNYDKIQDALFYNGYAKEVKIGGAKSILVQVKPMADLIVSFLEKDMDLFSDKKPIPEEWYKV